MNLTCLDVGRADVKIGDLVLIVSNNPNDINSVANLSKMIDTIPYEFLAKLRANIRRIIV
jgi:alanine racemase